MNIVEFLGRLHPLVVHVPIGLIPLAAIFYFLGKREQFAYLHKALPLTLFLSALSAIAAVIFGWLLAEEGGFQSSALFWHRWMGVSFAVLTALMWISQITQLKNNTLLSGGFMILGVMLVTFTGHLGGALTHGEEYLTQPLFGEAKEETLELPMQNDSIDLFQHLIAPALEKKCYSCHNENKQNGGLNLATWEGIEKGGKSGPIIEHSVWESELFKRVTLPQTNQKFMPPNGEPFTFAETQILKWWITSGADSSVAILELEPSEAIMDLLLHEYGIDLFPKPFVESIVIDPIDSTIVNKLRSANWHVESLAQTNALLDVKWKGTGSPSDEELQLLSLANEHITWLDLSGCNLKDQHLEPIKNLVHLTRLRLQDNQLEGKGLSNLSGLPHLESLNLNGNPLKHLI